MTTDSKRPEFLQSLLRELSGLLHDHGSKLAKKGRELGKVTIDSISMATKEIEATVVDPFTGPHKVEFNWNEDPQRTESFVEIVCDCATSKMMDLCKHTWAATRAIQTAFSDRSTPIARKFLEYRESEEWKQSLASLDDFLQVFRNKSSNDELAAKPVSQFGFRVGFSYHGPSVTVSEQTQLKKGGWGKWKRISWRTFLARSTGSSSPSDRPIFEYVQQLLEASPTALDSYNYGALISTWKLLKLLAGYQRIFLDSDEDCQTPYELKLVPPALTVREVDNDKLVISPAYGDHQENAFQKAYRFGDLGYVGFDTKTHKIAVCESTMQIESLFNRLRSRENAIPKGEADELLKRLTEMEQSLQINYPKSLRGKIREGSSDISLRLTPRLDDGGINFEIWARPVEGGSYFEPGRGKALTASLQNGERLEFVRKLEAEVANAERCQQELGLTNFPQTNPFRWTIRGGDHTLDFLDRLRELNSDNHWPVEWANSSIPQPTVIGELLPANLVIKIDSDRDWFGVEGTVSVAGHPVPLIQILNALRNDSRYVQLPGGQWAKIGDEFRQRLESLADLLHRNQSKLQFDTTAVPLLEKVLEDSLIEVKAVAEWRAAVDRLHRAKKHDPQVPKELQANLRDYQIDGFKWLSRLAAWGVGGCLADDMGLGKTIQTLAVLIERKKVGPTLVIAPVSVGFNWLNETNRFAPCLRPHLYRNTERGEFLDAVQGGDVVITSYGLLLRDASKFTKVKWGTLVIDEAQFVKNSRTKTAQVIRDLQSDWRLSLTGTPVENQLSDLWSLFRATAPGLFGSWERFRTKFADPIEKQKIPERQQALSRTVKPFILRRTKKDVLKELPERTEIVLTAELSETERKLYEDARLLALAEISGIDTGHQESRFQVLAMLTRLRQLACHPKLINPEWTEGSAKLTLMMETVDELREGGHRALVFSQFTSHLELIRKELDSRKISYVYLDGQTPEKQRRERVEAFQNGTGDLFLISLKAGGTGLNLTAADYVIHMDPWWNPSVEDQATDRAHRIGQTKAVMVYRLVSKDTIEEKILTLHGVKRNLVANIMDGTDQAGKLSTDELVDLIRTSTDAERPEVAATSPAKAPRKVRKKS